MDRTAIPQDDHRAAQLPEQTPEEVIHHKPGDVPGLKPLVQGDFPALRAYGKSTDAGDATLLVAVVVKWRTPARRPRAFEIGGEQEA